MPTIVTKGVGGAGSRDVVRVSERDGNVCYALEEGRNDRSDEGVPGAVLWEDGPQVGDERRIRNSRHGEQMGVRDLCLFRGLEV